MNKADHLFMAYQHASEMSDDPVTQNGSVLILPDTNRLLFGTNHLPPGVAKTDQRLHTRPTKYLYIEHAERDVIFKAARKGYRTEGATLVVPWFACADCARAIVCAGIAHVIGHKQILDKTPDRWRKSVDEGWQILTEGGVTCELYDGWIRDVEVLFDGSPWEP